MSCKIVYNHYLKYQHLYQNLPWKFFFVWFISLSQPVRQFLKKVVYILRIGWSIDTVADPFIIGIVNSEHIRSRLFGSWCVGFLQIKAIKLFLAISIKPPPWQFLFFLALTSKLSVTNCCDKELSSVFVSLTIK